MIQGYGKLGEQLYLGFSRHKDSLTQIGMRLFFLLLIAYLAASLINAFLVPVLGDFALQKQRLKPTSGQRPQLQSALNYRKLGKTVVARNIFNATGEVPDEPSPERQKAQSNAKVFDDAAACEPSSLDVELLGTIYLGPGHKRSVATVKEKGYNVADIYHEGDTIIGHADARIHAVGRRRVVIDNGGNKECLELKDSRNVATKSATSYVKPKKVDSSDEDLPSQSSRVILETSYVLEALGPGYGKILTEGRLVPFQKDNQMLGYKLISAKPNSLYTKLGLKSGDIITSVNGVSMTQPEQGFALYQSLSEDKEIRVEVLHGGEQPNTITVEIK